MMYRTDEYDPCQWPKCRLDAKHQVVHEHESIMVCSSHRAAVVVNIETQGKIWIFSQNDGQPVKGAIVRPGEQKPRFKGQTTHVRPQTAASKQEKQQEAARRADAAAVPVSPLDDIVKPRKRTEGHDAASRILGDSVRGG